MANIVKVDYVDHGVQNEYGPFGKVIASSDVRGWPEDEISLEISLMRTILGSHIVAVQIEEIPAIA